MVKRERGIVFVYTQLIERNVVNKQKRRNKEKRTERKEK
jgi:hypothetical protein